MGRKEDILDAAQESFIKFGLDKITLDDIALECGMKKSALYYYFKNKDEILGAMITRIANQISDQTKTEVMKYDNVKDCLRAFMKTKINIMRKHIPFIQLFERSNMPKKTAKFLREIQRKSSDADFVLVKNVIQQGIKNQRISYETSDSLVLMILGVTYGSFVGKHMDSCGWDIDIMIETTIDVIFKGIEKR